MPKALSMRYLHFMFYVSFYVCSFCISCSIYQRFLWDIFFLFISCSCRLGVLGNDGRSCNYTGVLYYLTNNYTVFIDTRNKRKQSVFLPSNGTVRAVTYDFQKRRLFYVDFRSENPKITVIFPGNGTRREIYLAGKHKNLFSANDNFS